MCLFTLQDKPFVAEENIVCYKCVDITKCGIFYSPVIGRNIPDDVISGKRLYRAKGIFRRAHIHKYYPWLHEVGKGWIHTCTSSPVYYVSAPQIWFECVIPKGTKYWKSEDGEEYASRSIRFVKPCEGQIRALYADCIGGARLPTEEELSGIVGSLERTKEFFKKFA